MYPDLQLSYSHLERNNIPYFRFHDLRHYSSIRHTLGITDAYIMADGGWSSDKVLKAVYRHAMDDRKRKCPTRQTAIFNHFFRDYDTIKKMPIFSTSWSSERGIRSLRSAPVGAKRRSPGPPAPSTLLHSVSCLYHFLY